MAALTMSDILPPAEYARNRSEWKRKIGALKRDLLKQVKDPVALDLMRAVKRALDPRGLLNPGKVL